MITCRHKPIERTYCLQLDQSPSILISYDDFDDNQELQTLFFTLFNRMHITSSTPYQSECVTNYDSLELFCYIKQAMRQPKTRHIMEASILV